MTETVSEQAITEPVEWRYLAYGCGPWKHAYSQESAAKLEAENAHLPARKRHVIEPLYPDPRAVPFSRVWLDDAGVEMVTIDGLDYPLSYVRAAMAEHIKPTDQSRRSSTIVEGEPGPVAWTSRREQVIAYIATELETSPSFSGDAVKALVIGTRIYDNLAVALAVEPVSPLMGTEAVRGVAVRPLEWEEPSKKNNGLWVARTVLGTYCVGCEGGWWYAVMDEGFRTWEWEPENDARSYSGPHAGMAAAQADYDSRIRSALL